jgi:hypothetical protein
MVLLDFLRQNGGRLWKRARENEFTEVTADEMTIEQLYDATVGAS